MNEPASFVHGTPDNTCPPSQWDDVPLPYHPSKCVLAVGYLAREHCAAPLWDYTNTVC